MNDVIKNMDIIADKHIDALQYICIIHELHYLNTKYEDTSIAKQMLLDRLDIVEPKLSFEDIQFTLKVVKYFQSKNREYFQENMSRDEIVKIFKEYYKDFNLLNG